MRYLGLITTCVNNFEVFWNWRGARIAEHIFLHINGTAIATMAHFHHFLHSSIGLAVCQQNQNQSFFNIKLSLHDQYVHVFMNMIEE